MRYVIILVLLAGSGLGGWMLGSQQSKTSAVNSNKSDSNPSPLQQPTRIRGIGKLQPANGVFKIFAPRGERIDSIYGLKVGDRVQIGQPLVRLASLEIRKLELEIALAKKRDAQRQLEFERSQGLKKRSGAELSVAETESIQKQIDIKAGGLSLLESQLAVAKKQLSKLQDLKSNPLTATMIGTADIEKQNLLITRLTSQISQSEQEIALATEKAGLARAASQLELEAVDLAIEGGAAAIPENSLAAAIKAAEKAVELSEIKSPVAGEILDIVVQPGDTAINQPVMLIGDTTEMVCLVEINDVNFRYAQPGDEATITSVALPEPLKGTVLSRGMMIGPPSMKDPNPFASVDRATGQVVVELANDQAARTLVNLQVEVDIEIQSADKAVSTE